MTDSFSNIIIIVVIIIKMMMQVKGNEREEISQHERRTQGSETFKHTYITKFVYD